MNSNNSVEERILQVFKLRYGINIDQYEDFLTKELMGPEIGLIASDLLYFFFDIEKEFGIRIDQKDIIGGKFNNLNNINKLVEHKLNSNSKAVV